jgi:hypothetical protein
MAFWIEGLRHAARRIVRAPSFFLTITLMLALGN